MIAGLLPADVDEAFGIFIQPEPDTPHDCHNHCDCFYFGEECCDCGDHEPPTIEAEIVDAKDAIDPEESDFDGMIEHPPLSGGS